MDVRGADNVTLHREMIDRAIAGINTCLPGVIDSFDPATQTVSVTPAIKLKIIINEVVSYLDLPKIVNVPIVFPFSAVAGFALTFPVSAGDSCLLIFSQRAIDNWHLFGGVQPPEQNTVGARHHELTDAFAILAPSALPDVLGSWSSNGIELRNRARTSRITVKEDKVEVVFGNTSLTVSAGKVSILGNLEVSGSISDGVRTIAADRLIFNTHNHNAPGGDTGSPYQQQ